jgi:hypothetical protein
VANPLEGTITIPGTKVQFPKWGLVAGIAGVGAILLLRPGSGQQQGDFNEDGELIGEEEGSGDLFALLEDLFRQVQGMESPAPIYPDLVPAPTPSVTGYSVGATGSMPVSLLIPDTIPYAGQKDDKRIGRSASSPSPGSVVLRSDTKVVSSKPAPAYVSPVQAPVSVSAPYSAPYTQSGVGSQTQVGAPLQTAAQQSAASSYLSGGSQAAGSSIVQQYQQLSQKLLKQQSVPSKSLSK